MIVFINTFTVAPGDQQRLLDLLARVTDEVVRHAEGFLSSTLHRGLEGTKVTMYAQWASMAHYEAMREDPRPLPYFQEALTFSSFEPASYEVVRAFSPEA